ncbi:hypothetical protein PAXRUDRAFT_18330 [Paxillus rubicundulus Ve08.2h10]|uniref:Uncharacterized protein n=1 Tax=Paxillus rubicundulus Ve08.2h10 TaxID=930991 RepID=A0A0D0CLV0_9AGAM|nr:hypothetical protein PAXRUDRAFT_18330 [Paxillus rubicundulus Ve08.2h10]
MEAEAEADAQAAADAAAESKEESGQGMDVADVHAVSEDLVDRECDVTMQDTSYLTPPPPNQAVLRVGKAPTPVPLEGDVAMSDIPTPASLMPDQATKIVLTPAQSKSTTPITPPLTCQRGVSLDPLDFSTSLDHMNFAVHDSDGIAPPSDSSSDESERSGEQEAMPMFGPPVSRGRGWPRGSRNVNAVVTHERMQLRERMKQAKLGVIGASRSSGPSSTVFDARIGIEDIPSQGQEVHSVQREKPAPVKQRASKKPMVSTKIHVNPEVSTLVEVERNPDQGSKHTFRTIMLTVSPKKRENIVTPKESGRHEALPTATAIPGASTSCKNQT